MAKLLFISFNTICFGLCQTLCIFALWIEWSCKPLDKGKLTAFPRLNIVSINLKMSDMLKFEELPKINSERWLLLKDFEGEVWKDVVGYEGLYKVSNYGRIKALGRMRKTHHNGLAQIKDRIIRNIPNVGKDGTYYYASFAKKDGENSSKKILVHRVVAMAFLPNPNKQPQVNHKDENPSNNIVFVNKDGSVDFFKSNLEWCTAFHNIHYGTRDERVRESRIKSGMSFGVVEIDEQNNIINRYVSIRHAAKILHTNANRFSKWCKQGGGVWKNGKIYKMLEVYDR